MSIALMSEQDRQISEIIAAEGSRLRNFIRRRVPNEADAEDLLQEVFYEVLEAFRLREPVLQWSAWIFRVARNRIIDLLRKKRRWVFASDPEPQPGEAQTSLIDSLPARDSGPASAYFRGLLLDEIEDALDELPAQQRDVFIAHEIEGESFKQMAARTGININTLLSRKQYAVAHLRRRLDGLNQDFQSTGDKSR